MIGIYKIENIANQRFYLGSSIKNITDRWASHRSVLGKGMHENHLLQEDWNLYGENSFQFVVLEILPRNQVLLKEQELLNQLFDNGKSCYNLSKWAKQSYVVPQEQKTQFSKISVRPEIKNQIDAIANNENRFVYEVVAEMVELYIARKGN